MQVLLAEEAGFCHGVKRAVELTLQMVNEGGGPWFTLGPLVHNRKVVEYLAARGISPVENIESLQTGGIVIRSHGVTPDIIEAATARGLRVVDATCHLVKRVQQLARQSSEQGYQVVIIGDREHPEVEGIIGWASGKAVVVSCLDEAVNLPHYNRIAVMCQTTKTEELYHAIAGELVRHAGELRAYNTICGSSSRRQEAAVNLARQVDVMVVIGDRSSSNTRSLAEVCKTIGVPTYLIESRDELRPEWFYGVEKVGVTAGASTPEWLIKEVLDFMSDLETNAAQVEQEKEMENEQAETSFAELEAEMAESLQAMERGTILKGTVIQVTDGEVMVDVGGKSEAIIPLRELSVRDLDSARDVVRVGDEVEVMVLRWDEDGTILVSKRRVDQEKALDALQKAYSENKPVSGTVVKEVKGGLLVDVGVLGFLPASQAGEGYMRDLTQLIGQELRFKVIEFNRNKRRGSQVVLSRRKLLEEEREERRQRFWDEIAEGQIRTGIVKKLTDYGAFVDVGGFEGLLHISEIDYARIEKPSDVLSEGQEIEVYILGVDPETRRVSLSRKKVLQSPWHNISERYHEGNLVSGKIVRIVPFGAFVELEPGVDGLIHISQLSKRRVARPEEVVRVGQQVTAKVIGVNQNEKRIALSLKEVDEGADEQYTKEYLEQQQD